MTHSAAKIVSRKGANRGRVRYADRSKELGPHSGPYRFARNLFSLFLLTAILAGCGKGIGIVSGKITFKGEPLPSGRVTFLGQDGRVANGVIDETGTYMIQGAPTGKVTILVDSKPPKPIIWLDPPDKRPKTPPPAKHLPIPERYGKSAESGLTYTVRKGEQTHDIELQP